ncbi:MAG: 30S ribosomal protein S9, partial [Planctomycetota bacterium]|nr:30S ribosomal protein S9 [Planctomycetota bacterium]
MVLSKDKITGDALGTGRRKSSVARVRIRAGEGKVTINKRPLDDYFCREQDRNAVMAALEQTGKAGEVDIVIRVHGGGMTGQSGACKLGIARALRVYDDELSDTL